MVVEKIVVDNCQCPVGDVDACFLIRLGFLLCDLGDVGCVDDDEGDVVDDQEEEGGNADVLSA